MLVLDGVYTAPDALSAPTFHPATRITDAEVAGLLFTIHSRVLRLCRRRGLMGEEGELDVSEPTEPQGLLPLICAASIQARSALGSEPGARVERRGIPELVVPGRAVVIKELCAELDGFSLHAAVRVEADQTSRLEHLCRGSLSGHSQDAPIRFAEPGLTSRARPSRTGVSRSRPTAASCMNSARPSAIDPL